jgi:hypothetical protein
MDRISLMVEVNFTPPTIFLAGFIMAPNNNNFGIEPLTAIASQDCNLSDFCSTKYYR